jgi:hypothetical protein
LSQFLGFRKHMPRYCDITRHESSRAGKRKTRCLRDRAVPNPYEPEVPLPRRRPMQVMRRKVGGYAQAPTFCSISVSATFASHSRFLLATLVGMTFFSSTRYHSCCGRDSDESPKPSLSSRACSPLLVIPTLARSGAKGSGGICCCPPHRARRMKQIPPRCARRNDKLPSPFYVIPSPSQARGRDLLLSLGPCSRPAPRASPQPAPAASPPRASRAWSPRRNLTRSGGVATVVSPVRGKLFGSERL